MKRIIGYMLILAMLVTLGLGNGSQTYAASAVGQVKVEMPLTVVVNGNQISFPDDQPFVDENGRTEVPARFVSEALGATVTWTAKDKLVTIKRNNDILLIWIGYKTIYVNGQSVLMDTNAIIKGGRTFVPAKYIAETLGAKVTWDGAIKTVYIDMAKDAKSPIAKKGEIVNTIEETDDNLSIGQIEAAEVVEISNKTLSIIKSGSKSIREALWENMSKLRNLKGLPEPFAVDSGNMGSAWSKIDGEMDEVISAFSKYSDEAGFATYRENRQFQTLKVNSQQVVDGVDAFDRAVDSEAKILEEIAARLGNKTSATGSINLYTERACCTSCKYVIQQFQQKYPNIIVNVIYGKPLRDGGYSNETI